MMIYLASPYTCKCAVLGDTYDRKECEQRRYEKALDACAELMRAGAHVLSPIVHSHPIAMSHAMPTDYGYWRALDEDLIERCYIDPSDVTQPLREAQS